MPLAFSQSKYLFIYLLVCAKILKHAVHYSAQNLAHTFLFPAFDFGFFFFCSSG